MFQLWPWWKTTEFGKRELEEEKAHTQGKGQKYMELRTMEVQEHWGRHALNTQGMSQSNIEV